MKLLLLALVILIGAGAFLLWRNGGAPVAALPFLPASAKKAPKPAVPPAAPKPEPKSTHAAKGGGAGSRPGGTVVAADRPQDAVLEPPPTQPETRTSSARVRPPHPIADKISVGTVTSAVTDAFGVPSAWAVNSESGHLVETLVYSEEREHSEVVIRIVDGQVASVYTKAEPANPRGSVIRAFGLQN